LTGVPGLELLMLTAGDGPGIDEGAKGLLLLPSIVLAMARVLA